MPRQGRRTRCTQCNYSDVDSLAGTECTHSDQGSLGALEPEDFPQHTQTIDGVEGIPKSKTRKTISQDHLPVGRQTESACSTPTEISSLEAWLL